MRDEKNGQPRCAGTPDPQLLTVSANRIEGSCVGLEVEEVIGTNRVVKPADSEQLVTS